LVAQLYFDHYAVRLSIDAADDDVQSARIQQRTQGL